MKAKLAEIWKAVLLNWWKFVIPPPPLQSVISYLIHNFLIKSQDYQVISARWCVAFNILSPPPQIKHHSVKHGQKQREVVGICMGPWLLWATEAHISRNWHQGHKRRARHETLLRNKVETTSKCMHRLQWGII